MSTSLNIIDPALENIISKAIDDANAAYQKTLNTRSNAKLPNSNLSQAQQSIIKAVVQRLENSFKEYDNKNNSSAAQMYQIQEICRKKMAQLQEQNKADNDNVKALLQQKSNMNKFMTSLLLMVALKYSSMAMARKNALKKLKTEKLRAEYLKWRKRRKIKLAEEQEKNEQLNAPEPTEEEKAEIEAAYKEELRMLWGDLFEERANEHPSELTSEFTAALAADNLGDDIHQTITDLHKDLGFGEMHPEVAEQFKKGIVGLKQNLFEIDRSLANRPANQTTESVLAAAYTKFENHVLAPLEKWRADATRLILDRGEDVAKNLKELDNRFMDITRGLTSWVRGEYISRQNPAPQQTEELKNTQETLAIDPERVRAARAAATAMNAKPEFGLSAFQSAENAAQRTHKTPAVEPESAAQPEFDANRTAQAKPSAIPKPSDRPTLLPPGSKG